MKLLGYLLVMVLLLGTALCAQQNVANAMIRQQNIRLKELLREQANAANVDVNQKNVGRRDQSNAANVDIDQANIGRRAAEKQANKAVVIIEQKNVAAGGGGY
jgi:hypothetical protein